MKVLVASGFAQESQAADFLHAGALAFLKKPVNRRALSRAVARALAGEPVG